MEVKIDADELCELKKRANMNAGAVYGEAFDQLREERDFWRDEALGASDYADCLNTGQPGLYRSIVHKRAVSKGYKVQE